MKFSNRLDALSSGVFTRLAEKKRELCGRGVDVIDLSVGSPDRAPAPHIVEALVRSAQLAEANYAYPIMDKPELREAVCAWYARRFNVTLDPKAQVHSLCGSQDGLAHIALALCDPGDVVLVPGPCYPIFSAGPIIGGAKVYEVPQREELGGMMDLGAIPADVLARARLIIASYPNNPTCSLARPGFFEELVRFAQKHDIAILHDNAYCELTFDGARSGSFLEVEGACDVGVEFNSLSKTYNMAGCRVGFALGNAEMIARIARIKSQLDYGVFLPVQDAAIAALNGPQDCVAQTRSAYQERRDVLVAGLRECGWPVKMPEGTMFCWAKMPDCGMDSLSFALWLADVAGVIATPGSSFGLGGEGHLRFALVADKARTAQAVERVRCAGRP